MKIISVYECYCGYYKKCINESFKWASKTFGIIFFSFCVRYPKKNMEKNFADFGLKNNT